MNKSTLSILILLMQNDGAYCPITIKVALLINLTQRKLTKKKNKYYWKQRNDISIRLTQHCPCDSDIPGHVLHLISICGWCLAGIKDLRGGTKAQTLETSVLTSSEVSLNEGDAMALSASDYTHACLLTACFWITSMATWTETGPVSETLSVLRWGNSLRTTWSALMMQRWFWTDDQWARYRGTCRAKTMTCPSHASAVGGQPPWWTHMAHGSRWEKPELNVALLFDRDISGWSTVTFQSKGPMYLFSGLRGQIPAWGTYPRPEDGCHKGPPPHAETIINYLVHLRSLYSCPLLPETMWRVATAPHRAAGRSANNNDRAAGARSLHASYRSTFKYATGRLQWTMSNMRQIIGLAGRIFYCRLFFPFCGGLNVSRYTVLILGTAHSQCKSTAMLDHRAHGCFMTNNVMLKVSAWLQPVPQLSWRIILSTMCRIYITGE